MVHKHSSPRSRRSTASRVWSREFSGVREQSRVGSALCAPHIAIGLLLTLVGPAGAQPTIDHGVAFDDASAQLPFIRVDDPISAHLGGAAWLDFDGDDDIDLFLPNAPGGNNALFRNDGGRFTDVAATAGLTGDGSGFTGALAGDIDNDGDPDLLLSGAGGFIGVGLPSRLYRNNGDGTFSDITPGSGIDADHLALMAAFGDIDNDGFIDLFVTSPGDLLAGVLTTQKLYRNHGDGTFRDISEAAGIDSALGGCVVAFSDFNGDRYPDILVGNCGLLDLSGPLPMPIPGPWEMWINRQNRTFADVGSAVGLDARPGYPMALTFADHDRDGDLDFFATGMGPNNPFTPGLLGEQMLFSKRADGTYADDTYSAGLGGFEWGWGASFADFDNDGDDDLATVGSVASAIMQFLGPLAGPGRVYENDGDGLYTATINLGLENQATSGLAVADYDADGFVDMVIVKNEFQIDTPNGPMSGDGAPVLLRNKGNSNRSVTLKLVGTQCNRMAIGARVEVTTRDGTQVREVAAGTSFASTNSPWVTVGLGHRERARVVVRWPSGLDEAFLVRAGTGLTTLVEGTGRAL